MLPLLALLPSFAMVVAILGFGATGLQAASLAIASTSALWLTGLFAPVLLTQLGRAIVDGGILSALVAAMIVPGVLFVESTRKRNTQTALGAVVDALRLTAPAKAMLIGCGLGVMVESLTGMGVSLLVTIPLLAGLLDRRRAVGVALVGMSLMTWGALSISAHVGSKLSGLPMPVFAAAVVASSGAVAFFLPSLCLLFVPGARLWDRVLALGVGAVLVAGIWAGNRWLGVEVAGVTGGLAVIVAFAAVAERTSTFWPALAAPGLRPYLVLMAAVAVQKAIAAPLESIGFAPALATDRVRFALLTSPGVALLAATLVSAGRSVDRSVIATVVTRSWRPILSVALFMISARLLVEMQAIAQLASLLGGLGTGPAIAATTLIGAVGGFASGSGVTSNALFMPSAAATGQLLGHLPLFAALQNGAGGHVAIASLPIAAILLTALGARQPGDDKLAMQTGLTLAAWHLCVLMAITVFWLWQGP